MNKLNERLYSKSGLFYLVPNEPEAMFSNRFQKLKTLYLIQALLSLSKSALYFFMRGELGFFDAHVGENMCEIRAHKTLELANQLKHKSNAVMKNDHEILCQRLSAVGKLIETFEYMSEMNSFHTKELDGKMSLYTFVMENDIGFQLSEDSVYIIACYFLSKFCIRESGLPTAMDYQKIIKKLGVSKHIAKRITKKYQVIVSQIGVNFLFNLTKKAALAEHLNLFPLACKVADDNRQVLPCFFVSEILFSNVLSVRLPILLLVNRKTLDEKCIDTVYASLVSDKQGQFNLGESPLDTHQACVVISGEVTYKTSFHEDKDSCLRRLAASFRDYFLANMACHPQYAGNNLSALRDFPFNDTSGSEKQPLILAHHQKLDWWRGKALALACAKRAPTSILLRHIYASTFESEISRLKNAELTIEDCLL